MRVLFLLIVLAFSFSVAKADPVTVTAGSVQATRNFNPFFFDSIRGQNYNLWAYTNNNSGMSSPCYSGCSLGQTVSLGATTGALTGGDYWSGILNGTVSIGVGTPDGYSVWGLFNFIAPSVTLAGETRFSVPFIVSGQTFLINSMGQSRMHQEVSGAGIADIQLTETDGRYFLQSATYTFQTPEPMSIILLLSGLAGLGFKCKTRKRQ